MAKRYPTSLKLGIDAGAQELCSGLRMKTTYHDVVSWDPLNRDQHSPCRLHESNNTERTMVSSQWYHL